MSLTISDLLIMAGSFIVGIKLGAWIMHDSRCDTCDYCGHARAIEQGDLPAD